MAATDRALADFIDLILYRVSPKFDKIELILNSKQTDDEQSSESYEKYSELYTLCRDQILKCAGLMADIFKEEINSSTLMEETRNWVIERITCCLEKIDKLFEILSQNEDTNVTKLSACGAKSEKPVTITNLDHDAAELDIFMGDSFISWIDGALRFFNDFSALFVQDFDNCSKNKLNDKNWIEECTLSLSNFCRIMRELVFSAMNICQSCLPSDQKIINARCHVVLRESKNLLSEILIKSDFSISDYNECDMKNLKIKKKLHIPTIKIFIDVLKDAVQNLETSINRAVLSLVLKCLMDPIEPLNKVIKNHINKSTEVNSITEFDTHNDRIIQIGLFAISCSSDKQRVLQLKSCLASLEVLEAHLIPAVISYPKASHTKFFVAHWNQEIKMLKTLIFLIVDPIAFVDLILEQFLEKFNELRKENPLKKMSVEHLADLGHCVHNYIATYFQFESEVFQHCESLMLINNDLEKAIKECRAVADLFIISQDEVCSQINIEKGFKDERTSNESKIIKRLKLLYTLLLKISQEITIDNQSNEENYLEYESSVTNEENISEIGALSLATNNRSVRGKGLFKLFSLFKGSAKTESVDKSKNIKSNQHLDFATKNVVISRSNIIRKSQNVMNPLLSKTYVYKTPKIAFDGRDLMSVSYKMNPFNDEFVLANISKDMSLTEMKSDTTETCGNSGTKDRSIFYNGRCKSKVNGSLRRKVLLNRANKANNKIISCVPLQQKVSKERSIESLNDSLDLHITDILEQLSGLSDTMSLMKLDHTPKRSPLKNKFTNSLCLKNDTEVENPNVLMLKVNGSIDVTPKKVWNIRISNDKENCESVIAAKNTQSSKYNEDNKTFTSNTVDCGIDVSFGSNITTPERLNDLQQLEEKLTKLKQFWNK